MVWIEAQIFQGRVYSCIDVSETQQQHRRRYGRIQADLHAVPVRDNPNTRIFIGFGR